MNSVASLACRHAQIQGRLSVVSSTTRAAPRLSSSPKKPDVSTQRLPEAAFNVHQDQATNASDHTKRGLSSADACFELEQEREHSCDVLPETALA